MRAKDTRIAQLHNMELFRACRPKQLARIAGVLTEAAVPAGDVLTHEGAHEHEQCLVIADGEATVSRDGVELATLGPGALVGEMALLDHGPRSATVTALSPLRVLVFDPHEFVAVLDSMPSVRAHLLGVLVGRLRSTDT